MEIRIFSIRFAKRKAREKLNTELELLRKLENLNSPVNAAPEESHLVCEARMLKLKLDQIARRAEN